MWRNIEKLIPYARNPRTHSDAQIAQIAGSIREFGFTNPVLIDEKGGLIAGHGRVLGARQLGMTQVPTITLTGLTEVQRRAYVIADNKLALNAGWDPELLRLELGELFAERHLEIPAGVERQLVVGEHIGAALRRREVRQDDARHLVEAGA